jgi:hypothetical protein
LATAPGAAVRIDLLDLGRSEAVNALTQFGVPAVRIGEPGHVSRDDGIR